MYILIVEDDYLQAELIEEALRQEAALAPLEFERLSTESQFNERFEKLAANPPDLIIMDIMLRWTDPAPDMKAPPSDIEKDGYYRAGLRIEKLLAQDPRTRSVPIILYTILEDIDLEVELKEERLHYLPKDSKLGPLVEKIRSLIENKSTQTKT